MLFRSPTKANSDSANITTPETIIEVDLCPQVEIYQGSLKSNIEREIKQCGYVIGEWKFGSETEFDHKLERETGFEPATSTLARLRSTN